MKNKLTVKIENFRELLKVAQRNNPNHIVYKYKKNINTEETEYVEKKYIEFVNDIKYASNLLLNFNLRGKKIAVVGNNRYEWCVSYLAITTGDMIVVPLDKALPDNELESLIKRSGVEAIIFEKKHLEIMKRIVKENNTELKTLICMDDAEDPDIINFSEVLEQGEKLVKNGYNEYDNIEIDSNKMSIILFTSGTTNEPKGVMLSQNNVCSNIVAITKYVSLYPTDTLLSFLPIHHTFECTVTFLFGLYAGATVAFCDGLKYIQQNLKEYKVTVFVAVPLVLETMYKKIQKAIKESGKEKLMQSMVKVSKILLKSHIDLRKVFFKQILNNFGGHLRIVFYGAASMNRDTIVGYNDLGIDLIQGYGLTETSPVISAETDNRKKPGSAGLILDNLQCKIVEPNEEGVGEIIVKGSSVMLGYYKNEKATKDVLKDGWFYTGDYGYLDKDGFLFITGRKKDVIVLKNGKNVYPQEIEFLINKLLYVEESIVYQREQSTIDTMLCAKIVYNEELIEKTFGKKSKKEYEKDVWKEIKNINKSLPIYKRIKKIELTTEEFAKTTTQKVKRYKELEKVNK